MKEYSLAGIWTADIGDGRRHRVCLPGTLDENRIGHPDKTAGSWHPDATIGNRTGLFDTGDIISTRLTRKNTYEGPACFSRKVTFTCRPGERLFLEMERAKCPRIFIDGKEIKPFREGSLSTPYIYELTETAKRKTASCEAVYTQKQHEEPDPEKDEHEITIITDNSYPGLPRRDILCSSAASDETQTNWNGILGYLRLRQESTVFLSDIAVCSCEMLTVRITFNAAFPCHGKLNVSSEAFLQPVIRELDLPEGFCTFTLEHLPVRKNLKPWDLDEGSLYTLTAAFVPEDPVVEGCRKTVRFGVRFFGNDGYGHLVLNHRRIFLRCETNCAVFPETGYIPMEYETWKGILDTYRSYGVNCVRFHSHCPPEAAFEAADEMGMLMYPELSNWNPENAFETDESFAYYQSELRQVLDMLANHPSFVMLSFGNELFAGEKGHEKMRALLSLAHELDPTRLYAEGSNVHYGKKEPEDKSDFYTAMAYRGKDLRAVSEGMKGYLNLEYPDTRHHYSEAVNDLVTAWKKPVFGFEAGQYQSLPDFGELKDFCGVTEPNNYRLIQKRVCEKGLEKVWPEYVRSSGELALLCYREEVEAAYRTQDMSGIAILGLQDFPGQGTALIGMMNAHLQPKPYAFADPKRFRAFFTDVLVMAEFEKYTYVEGETFRAEIYMANYAKTDLEGPVVCHLKAEVPFSGCTEKQTPLSRYPAGKVTFCGTVEFKLPSEGRAMRLDVDLCMDGYTNTYPIWVYPNAEPVCPEDVYETAYFDETARQVLENGGKVYLSPPSTKEALPSSVQAQFSTDFWSIGSFPSQAGTMGQLIDISHPLLEDFPTEAHTNWQWWIMASRRAVILPGEFPAIITEMDSYARLRPMAQLLECRCLQGRVLFSTLGLQELKDYPEARWLQRCVYKYMHSAAFSPERELDSQILEALVP